MGSSTWMSRSSSSNLPGQLIDQEPGQRHLAAFMALGLTPCHAAPDRCHGLRYEHAPPQKVDPAHPSAAISPHLTPV